VLGAQEILGICVYVAILFIYRFAFRPTKAAYRNFTNNSYLSIAKFSLLILTFDLLVNLDLTNTLFFGQAVEKTIEVANENVGRGRGLSEILHAMVPFAIFASRDAIINSKEGPVIKNAVMVYLFFYIFLTAGSGRGFLAIALIALFFGNKLISYRQIGLMAFVGAVIFLVASGYRGDFETTQFNNPIIDGVFFPIYNLSLLSETKCADLNSFNYFLEFIKKFIPSLIIEKEVFSFNIEMTRCIYPMYADEVKSISVFTYAGEILVFRPPWLTAIIMSLITLGMCHIVERMIAKLNFNTMRMYCGFMIIYIERSRSLDLYSFFLLLILFLMVINIIKRLRAS
jgi:hypothetical protein